MAFPTVVNSSAGNSGANTTSWAFSYGFTATNGNLLILCIAIDGTADISTLTPSDWTSLGTATSSSAVRMRLYKRTSDGTDTGVTIAPGASQGVAATIHEFSGFNSLTDVEVGTLGTGTSISPNPPSLDPAGWGTEDTAWIATCVWDANAGLSAYPSNYTVSQQSSEWNNATDGVGVATAVRTNSQLGSEDPGNFTIGSQEWVAATIAIRTSQGATGTSATTLDSFTSTASGSSTTSSTGQPRLASINLSVNLANTLSIG